jgi:hypothetical protein
VVQAEADRAACNKPQPDARLGRVQVERDFFAVGRAGLPRLAGVEIGTELASKRFTAPYKSA